MKKSIRILSSLLAVLLLVSMLIGGSVASATNTVTYTNATEIYTYVRDGYNQGSQGPISITKGTLKSGLSSKTVYLVTLSGTELVLNQSTGVLTDLLSGFNLNNVYYANTVNIIKANVPKNANLIIAGHSLGGMIAQQVAADSGIKSRYNVLNTVCFGSPLLAAGSREGTVRRLGDVSDPVPYLSGSLFNNTIWAIMGLNREDGGYGIRGITAHNQSYFRTDLWGRYDVTGTKYGSAKLILDLDTRVFYQSPVIDW
jgi:pimeloyl-ACP methyl ester carboxylesterase